MSGPISGRCSLRERDLAAKAFGRSLFYVPPTRELFFSSTGPRRFSRYLDEQMNSDWDLSVTVLDAEPR